MLFKIMDLRAYARAKEVYDRSLKEPDMNKRPTGPMIERVRSMEFELAREKINKYRQAEAQKHDQSG
jgi:hypothetical protein